MFRYVVVLNNPYTIDMIEHIVYILWRHIDYYYHHCVPTDENYVQDEFSKTYQRARRLNSKFI